MALPYVSISRINGTLSPTPAGSSKALVIGPASSGSVDTVTTFGQPASLNSIFGYGPGVTAAQIMLADNGGSVDFIRATASIAGTVTSVVSSSNPAITVSGTPYDTYDFRGTISTAGAETAAKFTYSLDGGETVSVPFPASGSYSIPNTGLTLAFPAGTYVANTTFTFTSTAPQLNSTNVTDAINSFTGSIVAPTLVLIANHTNSATSGSALFTACDSGLTTLSNAELPTVMVLPTGGADAGTSATISAFSSKASSTGNVLELVSERARMNVPVPLTGYGNPQLPFAFAVASRLQGSVLSTNPARVADGGLARCSDPTYDEFVNGQVYQDASIGAPRTWKSQGGVFLQQSVLKSATGSSFARMEQCRVLTRADQVARQVLQRYINSAVRTLKDGTGYIDPRDANRIDADVNAALDSAIMQPTNAEGTRGLASGVLFAIDRNYDVLRTNRLQGTLSIIPLANVDAITVTLSFAVSLA